MNTKNRQTVMTMLAGLVAVVACLTGCERGSRLPTGADTLIEDNSSSVFEMPETVVWYSKYEFGGDIF